MQVSNRDKGECVSMMSFFDEVNPSGHFHRTNDPTEKLRLKLSLKSD